MRGEPGEVEVGDLGQREVVEDGGDLFDEPVGLLGVDLPWAEAEADEMDVDRLLRLTPSIL